MDDVIDRLLRAYGRELELYAEVADLAREGARLVRNREPLARLDDVDRRKSERLSEIECVDRGVAAAKDLWLAQGRDHARSRELDALLIRVARTIDRILEFEREADRAILAGSGIRPEGKRSSEGESS